MASSGSTYIDVLPNMSRYFREARAELAANRVTGQIDVEVERASLRRAERQLERLSDRNVSARNRSIAATERQNAAERELQQLQARSNVSTEQYAAAVERVGRAQRAAAEAATQRNRAQRDLNEGRDTVNTIRTRLNTAEAEQQHRGFIERIQRQVATITARIDLATAPYRAALRAATRPVTQTVKLAINNNVTRTVMSLLGSVGKLAGLFGAATIAAGALVGPVGAVLGGVIQLGGLVALLPGAILAAGAAFAAIKIGISGIGESLKGLGKPASGGGGAANSQAAQQAKAVASAERQLTQAQKGAERAQGELNKERALAVRRLRDMNAEVRQGSLDERGATIELQRAKDALAALGRDGEPVSFLDREQAQLDVDMAVEGLDRIKTANADLAEDNTKAQAAGIEGDAGVVAARQSVEDATLSVADAARSLAEAQAEVGTASAAAASAADEAYAKLSPNAKALVDTIRGLMPAFDDVKNSVQDALTNGLGGSLQTLVNQQLPGVKTGLTGIAAEINTGVRGAFAALSTDASVSALDKVLGNTTKATGNIASAFAPFAEAFLNIAAVGSEFLPGFTAGIGGAAEGFRAWAGDADKVRAFIEKALTIANQLGQVFSNVGGIISDVFGAAQAAGGGLLNNLILVTDQIRAFTSSAEGQEALTSFFASVGAVVGALAPIVLELARIIGTTVAPAIADFVTAAGPGVTELVKALGDGLAALAPALGPLGAILGQIGTALAPAMAPLGEALGAILNALGPILPMFAEWISLLVQQLAPVLTTLANALAPVIAQLVEQLSPYLPMIAELIGKIAGAIGEALVQAVVALAPMIPVIVDAFIQVLTALEPLIPVILDLAVKLIEMLVPVIPVLAAFITGVLVPAINFLVPIIRLMADGIIWLADKAIKYMQPIWEMLIQKFNDAKDDVQQIGQWFTDAGQSIRDFVDGAKVKFDEFIAWVKDIPNKVKSWLEDANTWLRDAGKNIIQGLIDGVKNKIEDVKQTFKDLTDKLPDWKGPADRDATLLFDAGALIISGLIDGLESQYGAVKDSLKGLTADVASVSIDAPAAPKIGAVDASALDTTKLVDPAATSATMTAALGQVQTGATALGAAFGGAANVSATTWQSLAQGISANKLGLIDPAFAGVLGNLNNAKTAFVGAANLINPTWRDTADRIMAVQRNTIDPAMTNTRDAVLFTADTFGVGADRIGQKWDGIRPKVAEPVRFAINNVFNDGLVGMWNSVNGLLGTPVMPRYNIGSFASGTSRLPGYSPGHDNLHLSTPDGRVGISLGGGEGIARPEVVRAIGPDKFDGLNAAAKMGGTKGVQNYLGGFSEGGILDSMANVVRAKFPGMSITSTYRPGDPGYHGRRQAMDFSNGSDSTAGMRAAAGYIADNYPQPITAQLIHQPFNRNIGQGQGFVGDGLGFYGAGTMSEHRNHVHWAANGLVPLIPGGPIDPALYANADAMGSVDYTSIVAGMTKPFRDKINSTVGGYKADGMIGGIPKATSDKMVAAADAKIAAATAALQAASGSVTMGPLGGNSMDYARQITDAAKDRSLGKEGARIGVATALVESGLRMYANASVPASLGFPHDAVGSDHDSVGLFQQRQAGWGTLAERMNAKASAGLFFNKLMTFDWRSMDPGAAAQRVQVSAFPGRYSQEMGRATGIVDSVFDRGGVAEGRGFMLKDVIHPERVLDPHDTKTYDSMLPLLESINSGARATRAATDPRELEYAGLGNAQITGQHVENQYLVDPAANERTTRRATKRAVASAGVL